MMDAASILSFQTIHTNYVRNSRAIAVLWCVFTICFAIINIIVFMQPWLASTSSAQKEGYFGLYESCYYDTQTFEIVGTTPTIRTETKLFCRGTWTNFGSSLNAVSTFFIGFSALNNLICIATFLVLFLFINPAVLFIICGVLQVVSSLCMLLGCVLYPYNWDSERILNICETSSPYSAGNCQIKWAFILAIIGIFDILCLAILAFVLAARQAPNLDLISAASNVDVISKHSYANDNSSYNSSRYNSMNRQPSRRSTHDMQL